MEQLGSPGLAAPLSQSGVFFVSGLKGLTGLIGLRSYWERGYQEGMRRLYFTIIGVKRKKGEGMSYG
jgi:hypothetical protein